MFRVKVILFFLLGFSLLACGNENVVVETSLTSSTVLSVEHDHETHDHGGHDHGGHDHHSDEDLIDLSSVANPPNI